MTTDRATELLRALPASSTRLVRAVIAGADAQRLEMFLVGGPVRDHLLGRPITDVDLLVVDPTGGGAAELARILEQGDLRVTRHDRFGTMTLQDAEGSVDLASARKEQYAHDGALPSVEAGTLEEDLRRRDFTVNALAAPLSRVARTRHPEIVDLEGGLRDLEQRRLRVLHPRSFHDDPTRALRAARLQSRLGMALSRGTRGSLRDALRDGAFGRVSGDRLRRELVKLFDNAAVGLDPAQALRLLDEWHVLGALEPGLSLRRQAAPSLRRLGRMVAAPPWSAPRWRPWCSGLSLWLAPLEPELRRRSLKRFAVRGEAAERIATYPRSRDTWLRALERARGRGAIDAVLAGLDEDALHALDAGSAPKLRLRIERWATQDRLRRMPVNGEDLIEVGLSGPAIGRALGRIRVAYLDGGLRSRDEAIALARELLRRSRSKARRA